jgi:hypothetical protein
MLKKTIFFKSINKNENEKIKNIFHPWKKEKKTNERHLRHRYHC